MIQASNKIFDLGDRTSEFSRKLIFYLKSLPKDSLLQPLIIQALRAGTSVGANYREADGGESKKDFVHKIMICKKEAKETVYWLDLIKGGVDIQSKELDWLIDECQQFIRIFGKIGSN